MDRWTEYSLGQLLSYEQPTPYIVESTDYNDKYATPVLTAGKSFVLGYTDENFGIYNSLPVVIFDDFTTATQYVNFPFKVKSSAMKILTANTELVLPKFIFYRMQIIKFDHSTHKRYWIQQYSKIKVEIPSIPVQKQIVARIEELFSQLDSGVETLKKVKQQLAVYRQGVLENAFSGILTHEWRKGKDLPSAGEVINRIISENNVIGHREQMERIELPTLPDSWLWVSIGDVSKGAEYGTSQKSQKTGKVPVLRMGNIQNGVFDWSDLVYTNDEKEITKYLLNKGDVLFNRTNSSDLVGKTAAFKENRYAIFAGYLIRVNQVAEVDYRYLTYYLNCNIARRYGNKVKTDGVNQSNINSQKLYSYPFPFCCLEEQSQVIVEIESRLSVCDSIEQTVDTALRQAEAMRQSILKKAFEGRLL